MQKPPLPKKGALHILIQNTLSKSLDFCQELWNLSFATASAEKNQNLRIPISLIWATSPWKSLLGCHKARLSAAGWSSPNPARDRIPDLFRIWGLIILWIARMFVIRVWKAHRHVVVVDHKLWPHGSIFGDSGLTETDRCPNLRGLSFVSSGISSHQVPMTMMVNSNDIQAPSRCPELESKRSIWYTSNT